MKSRKKLFLLGIINALLFTVLLLIQYSTVISIKILTANPMLPLTLLVAIAMFSSELTACLTGLFVGMFVDSVASTPSGFNSIIFFILAFAVSLTVRYLFNNNIRSGLALCFLSSAIYALLRFVFCFAFSNSFSESLNYLLRYTLPSAVYTALLIIPFYYLQRFLFEKLSTQHY